jgi:hypothetical protein
MMLFDPEVGLSMDVGNVTGRQGGGREINECSNETKENWSLEMLPGDQRKVTSPQRLKQPMKLHVTMYETSCTPRPFL